MKKPIKSTKPKTTNKNNKRFPEDIPGPSSEKAMDAVPLSQEIPLDLRQTDAILETTPKDTTSNWSQPEDRSEDLINETDPFIQQPEKDTQIPPEMIQKRAYHLYEQRGGNSNDNLADWFEAERQIRHEWEKRRR